MLYIFVPPEAFIEEPESTAQNGLLVSRQIEGKPDARGERVPVVIHQALGIPLRPAMPIPFR